MMTKGMYTSNSEEWGTPQELFNRLNKEFNFTLDICASKENAKCPKYYTKEEDALKKEWGGRHMDEPSVRKTNRNLGKKRQEMRQGKEKQQSFAYCRHERIPPGGTITL